jgi:radical SAM protein with 4Fe4S-binding SPASM domain
MVVNKKGNIIYGDFRREEDKKDPCSECRQVSFCNETCERAFIYWENLANRLKGYDNV